MSKVSNGHAPVSSLPLLRRPLTFAKNKYAIVPMHCQQELFPGGPGRPYGMGALPAGQNIDRPHHFTPCFPST